MLHVRRYSKTLRCSWEISLVFFCFSVSIQIDHEKNLQIYARVTAANAKSVQSDVNVKLFKVNNKNTIVVVLLSYC